MGIDALRSVATGAWTWAWSHGANFWLAVAGAFFGTALAYLAWAHARHKATMELALRLADGEVASVRLRVSGTINEAEADVVFSLRSLQEAFKHNPPLERDVASILNHLECACIGFDCGYYHDDVFRHLYGSIVTRYYARYGEWIRHLRTTWGSRLGPETAWRGTWFARRTRLRGRHGARHAGDKRAVWAFLEDVAVELRAQGYGPGPGEWRVADVTFAPKASASPNQVDGAPPPLARQPTAPASPDVTTVPSPSHMPES